jgi:taurine dioxygenase
MTCDSQPVVSRSSLWPIAREVQVKGYKIFHELEHTEQSYIDYMKGFGELERHELFMNSKQVPELFYVTDRRTESGDKIGMFGGGELGWHSNGNSRNKIDKILISLYCVDGDPNTTLSVCNTSLPFYDLSDEDQEYFKNITIRLKFKNNTMYELDDDDPELEFMSKNKGSIIPLVGRHPHTDKYYFYFPYHFIYRAWHSKTRIDHEELIERLKPIIFKSKYQIHHVFQKGDMLLMDQLTTLHRRTPVMGDRMLWRAAGDYSKV